MDPAGVALEAKCFFEYGETEAYGHVAACESPDARKSRWIRANTRCTRTISGLVAGRSYHYRLVADNVNDAQEPVFGGDVVFGPPVLVSESSVEVTAGDGRVEAEVDPQNVDTRVRAGIWHWRGVWAEYG